VPAGWASGSRSSVVGRSWPGHRRVRRANASVTVTQPLVSHSHRTQRNWSWSRLHRLRLRHAPASAPCPSERCVAFTLRHRRRATDTTLGLQNRFAVACWSPVAATTVPPTDGGSGAERSRAGVASLLRQPTPSIRPNRIPSIHAYSSCAEAAINYYHSFSYKNKKKKRKRTDTLTSRSVVCATWRRIGEEGARLRRLAPTLTA
jgi:hypothetical protein